MKCAACKKDDVSGTLDWNDIRKKVLTHQEIVVISAREDLSIQQHVLHKFDMIQIYKDGLDILRIVNTESQDGRSVHVGINDYRRNVQRLTVSYEGALIDRSGPFIGVNVIALWIRQVTRITTH